MRPQVRNDARRIFYWTSTTATQPFNTGIQRVVRRLGAALEAEGIEIVPVEWDARRRVMQMLDHAKKRVLSAEGGPACAGGPTLPASLDGAWLLVPEAPVHVITADLNPVRIGRAYGMRTAAIVHDLIPLKHPSLYDETAGGAYRSYYRMFGEVDVAIATTRCVRDDLIVFLEAERLLTPPVALCSLSGQLVELFGGGRPFRALSTTDDPRLLMIGTWEPRKNHPRLLRALLEARRHGGGRRIGLTIVGLRGQRPAYDSEVDAILEGVPDIDVRDSVSDADLNALLAAHHASVYASWEEGFGLPVLESIWSGRPCLCHNGSAMAEVAPGGGALMVDMLDEQAIAGALRRLVEEDGLLDRLTLEAVARPMRTWREVAADVRAALEEAG